MSANVRQFPESAIVVLNVRQFPECRWRWSWFRLCWQAMPIGEDFVFIGGDRWIFYGVERGVPW